MISDLPKIWRLFTPRERRSAGWMLLLLVLMAVAETAGVLSIMPFLSVLARPEVVQESPRMQAVYTWLNFASPRDFIAALGIASIVLVIVASAFKTVTQHVLNRYVHFLRLSISSRLLSRYLHQPYEFFLGRNSAELSKNVLSETDQLVMQMIHPLAQMLAQGTILIAMAIVIIIYDPVMALCILSVLGLLYAAIYGLVRRRLKRIGHELVAANKARYQACNEALGGIRDIKITHSMKAYLDRFFGSARTHARHLATNDTVSQTPLYMVEAIGYTGLIVIALVLLKRSNDIAQVLPALGLYGFAAYRMLPAAQIIYRGFAKLRFSSAALDNIDRDLSLPEPADAQEGKPLVPRTSIRLEGVRYAYPSASERPVFDNYSLTIPVNTTVGITGRSGAGKSTLMDLLLGLLPPQAGALYIDDTRIDASNVARWQRSIGYVPQHIYLVDTSVAENIAFGLEADEIDMKAVERAARAAQIHDFIVDDLPSGYSTKLGERGIRLSGGQRQRIGIARALYPNPSVVFMDEGTSALDDETEASLTQSLSNLSKKKTIVIIAHKPISLSLCRVVVEVARS